MEEVEGKLEEIITEYYKDYFTYLVDNGFSISYNENSIAIYYYKLQKKATLEYSSSCFSSFNLEDIKYDIIPVVIMLQSKYNVRVSYEDSRSDIKYLTINELKSDLKLDRIFSFRISIKKKSKLSKFISTFLKKLKI